jgi:hypothetical protein
MPSLKESSAALSAGMQLPLDDSLEPLMEEVVARKFRKRKLAAAMARMEGTANQIMVMVSRILRNDELPKEKNV